ncbi:MAG TPA: 2-oxo acid dehydrogenase subunit E2 [Lentimicrobium sp.]|nr:2-oxo acid dehydrogenase subunit E2 [Lentimicrobium sp.]
MSEVEQVAVPDVEASLARDRAAAPPPAGIASPSASLFRTGSGALFQDQRAAKAGDILTIRIDISDKASVSNSTSRTRDGSESGGASAIFGLEKIVKDIVGVDTANLVGSQTSSSSSGKGSTSRSETISMTMAAIVTAVLPNGNLIVPVIRNADQKNLLGLAKDVNSLANKARSNKLEPDDIAGGTFTITNLGTFGSITGSPIINQPQVAILGIGVIKKKPVVLETADGDVIAIRHMMILSLSYDHRVVDGALGGMYLQRLQQLLESFDQNRVI